MQLLIAGLVIFIATHFIPSAPALRQSLVKKFSLKGYKAIFSLLSLFGLVLIVIGKSQAIFTTLYMPPDWGRHATMLLVLVAFILFPAAHMPTNIKRFTRHPMLWGIVLWSVGHLLANGDRASVVLFGSLGVFSLLAMVSANQRGAKLQTTKLPLKKDIVVVVAGLVVYGLLLFLHPYLFGYPVI